jgi:hypothetical protein
MYRDGWNNGADWQKATMWSGNRLGLRVVSFSRRALPQFGEAALEAPVGIFGKTPVNVVLGDNTNGTWSTQYSYVDTPDLTKKVIRIQAREGRPSGEQAADWRTVWLGVALFQENDFAGAAEQGFGVRRWRCIDLLYAYCINWYFRTHAYAPVPGTVHTGCTGHPGFNVDAADASLGNRSETDTVGGGLYYAHVLPGGRYAKPWTDEQVLNAALQTYRADDDPSFQLRAPGAGGAYSLFDIPQLQGTGTWPVDEMTNAWQLLTRVLRRQRGVGCAYLDWPADNDSGSSVSNINDLYLTVHPQHADNVTAGDTTIVGATSAETKVTVDLLGDHRCVDGSFRYHYRDEYRVDYLETVGEQIEVLITVSYEDGTLEPGWVNADDFIAADIGARKGAEFDLTYNRHELAVSSGTIFRAGDGNGGTPTVWAYECNDDGTVTAADTTTFSMAACEILGDLPLLENYDYSVEPAVAFSATEDIKRVAPMVLIRSGDDAYVDQSPYIQMKLAGLAAIDVRSQGDELDYTSTRRIGDVDALSSTYDVADLVAVLGVQLPSRLRVATGDATSYRRRTIYQPGYRMWLAHSGTIWTLDDDNVAASGAWPALRITDATGYRILHSDLDALKIKHALAWEWYGSEHRACEWTLRCCGLLPDHEVAAEGNLRATARARQDYPRLGQFVDFVKAHGESAGVVVATVITSVEYDNRSGETTWRTDWTELDV